MKLFGLTENQIKLIKEKIQKIFGTETDLKVYVFGSRAKGENRRNSDIDLAFKSKDKDLSKKIMQLKNELEDSSVPYKCDLVNWDEIIQDYLPTITKYKKLFWSKKDVVLASPWRVCPIGYHWVREHLKEGNVDTTNPHCRRNTSNKDILKADEIKKISEMSLFKNPSIKASTIDMGFNGRDKKYDDLINGWCAYWNYTLKPKEPLHPNHVKALIATESSFMDNHKRTPERPAIGLMQIMPNTIHLLSSRNKELKDHYLELSEEEVLDPSINICAGIRWLFRKYDLSKKKNKTWLNVFENYKGISKQKGHKTDRIRNDVLYYYNKLINE